MSGDLERRPLNPDVITVDPASVAGGALASWLRREILFDRHDAQACIDEPEIADRWTETSTGVLEAGTEKALDAWQYTWAVGDGRVSRHIVRHDPLEVLADCEAKLRLLDEHGQVLAALAACTREQAALRACALQLERVVRILAWGYRHREGWREEWTP